MVANEVDYVALENIKGRVSATLALIYPPGIGIVVPGERWDDKAKPMLDYFLAFQESFSDLIALISVSTLLFTRSAMRSTRVARFTL